MEHFLEDFPRVSTAEWEAAIARDLKDAGRDKRLIWQSEEGSAVKPFYRADDLKDLASVDSAPGTFPYRRGGRATGPLRRQRRTWISTLTCRYRHLSLSSVNFATISVWRGAVNTALTGAW